MSTTCSICGGRGWIEASGHAPGCDGVYCEQMCPIQIQDNCPARCDNGATARHVYQPLHTFPNSVGIGFGPCQYPGCTAEKNSATHGALDLGITRKVESDHGPEPR